MRARVQAWLLLPRGVRDARPHLRLARMLLALMDHSGGHYTPPLLRRGRFTLPCGPPRQRYVRKRPSTTDKSVSTTAAVLRTTFLPL